MLINKNKINNIISSINKILFWPNISANVVSLQSNNYDKKETLSIFVHYNVNNMIDESDLFYIEQLEKISDVCFITNSKIQHEQKINISNKVKFFIERENINYDFGAWKDFIINNVNIIYKYQHIILANNSVIGPLYDLSYLINKMSEYDFWGISKYVNKYQNIENKILNMKYIPTHIQSYFVVFNKSLINSDFINFWKAINNNCSFVDVVKNCEIVLTKYFEDRGYKWKVVCDTSDCNICRYNDFSKYAPDLLLMKGSPFIKKKSLEIISKKQIKNIVSSLSKSNLNMQLNFLIKHITKQHSIKKLNHGK